MKEILRITYAPPVSVSKREREGCHDRHRLCEGVPIDSFVGGAFTTNVECRRSHPLLPGYRGAAATPTLGRNVTSVTRHDDYRPRLSPSFGPREARSREKFQMQFYARTTRDPYVKRRSRLPSRSSQIILNAFNASTRVSPIAFRVSPLCSTRKFDSATIFLLLEIPFAVDALFSRFDEELDYTGKRIRMFLMEFRRF